MNVGDKIVCINEDISGGMFKKGQVYTVLELSYGLVRLAETGNVFWSQKIFAPYNVNRDVFQSLRNMGWKDLKK